MGALKLEFDCPKAPIGDRRSRYAATNLKLDITAEIRNTQLKLSQGRDRLEGKLKLKLCGEEGRERGSTR